MMIKSPGYDQGLIFSKIPDDSLIYMYLNHDFYPSELEQMSAELKTREKSVSLVLFNLIKRPLKAQIQFYTQIIASFPTDYFPYLCAQLKTSNLIAQRNISRIIQELIKLKKLTVVLDCIITSRKFVAQPSKNDLNEGMATVENIKLFNILALLRLSPITEERRSFAKAFRTNARLLDSAQRLQYAFELILDSSLSVREQMVPFMKNDLKLYKSTVIEKLTHNNPIRSHNFELIQVLVSQPPVTSSESDQYILALKQNTRFSPYISTIVAGWPENVFTSSLKTLYKN